MLRYLVLLHIKILKESRGEVVFNYYSFCAKIRDRYFKLYKIIERFLGE